MAIGVDLDGIKHIVGLWIAKEEGASLWAQVCANLSHRGVKDVFIVCCDGLKGLPQAVVSIWGSWYRCSVYPVLQGFSFIADADDTTIRWCRVNLYRDLPAEEAFKVPDGH